MNFCKGYYDCFLVFCLYHRSECTGPHRYHRRKHLCLINDRRCLLQRPGSNNTHVPLRGKSPSTPKGFPSQVRRKDQEGRPCPFSVAAAAAATRTMFFLFSTHQGQQQTKEKENAMPQVNRDVNDGNVRYRRRMFRRMNTRGLTKDR